MARSFIPINTDKYCSIRQVQVLLLIVTHIFMFMAEIAVFSVKSCLFGKTFQQKYTALQTI